MGKAETQSHHKPLTPSAGTRKGGISTPGASHWGVKGLYPILDTPAFKTCSWKTSPHNIWFWKPAGQTTQETHGSSKLRAGALTHRCQGPARKQPFEKGPGFLWKGLRCFDHVGLRGRGLLGNSGDGGWQVPPSCSPSFFLSFLPLFFLSSSFRWMPSLLPPNPTTLLLPVGGSPPYGTPEHWYFPKGDFYICPVSLLVYGFPRWR